MNTIMAIDTDKTVSALTAGSVNSADKAGEGFGNTAKNTVEGTIEGIKVTLREYFVKGQER